MKVYTKKGDEGMSRTLSGYKLPKYHKMFKLVGELDILNSSIGTIKPIITEHPEYKHLEYIQKNLLTLGAAISGLHFKDEFVISASDKYVFRGDTKNLEEWIDSMSANLPHLKNFILPTGVAHVARAECRKFERKLNEFLSIYTIENPEIIKGWTSYTNRLSDYLFVLSRTINAINEVEEIKF